MYEFWPPWSYNTITRVSMQSHLHIYTNTSKRSFLCIRLPIDIETTRWLPLPISLFYLFYLHIVFSKRALKSPKLFFCTQPANIPINLPTYKDSYPNIRQRFYMVKSGLSIINLLYVYVGNYIGLPKHGYTHSVCYWISYTVACPKFGHPALSSNTLP